MGNPAEETYCYPNDQILLLRAVLSTVNCDSLQALDFGGGSPLMKPMNSIVHRTSPPLPQSAQKSQAFDENFCGHRRAVRRFRVLRRCGVNARKRESSRIQFSSASGCRASCGKFLENGQCRSRKAHPAGLGRAQAGRHGQGSQSSRCPWNLFSGLIVVARSE